MPAPPPARRDTRCCCRRPCTSAPPASGSGRADFRQEVLASLILVAAAVLLVAGALLMRRFRIPTLIVLLAVLAWRPPGAPNGWHSRDALLAAIRDIRAHPIQQRYGASHEHHP